MHVQVSLSSLSLSLKTLSHLNRAQQIRKAALAAFVDTPIFDRHVSPPTLFQAPVDRELEFPRLLGKYPARGHAGTAEL